MDLYIKLGNQQFIKYPNLQKFQQPWKTYCSCSYHESFPRKLVYKQVWLVISNVPIFILQIHLSAISKNI